VLLVEGQTEIALKRIIKEYLDQRAEEQGQPRIRLQTRRFKRLNNSEEMGRQIKFELQTQGVDAVIGLVDVFPHFRHADAAIAKRFLNEAARRAGVTHGFYAHAAQYDVEAWLIPFWEDVCQRIGVHQGRPGNRPEQVDGTHPPSYRLRDLYRRAQREYTKTTEMSAILKGKDLTIAANACPELKNLLNTLLALSYLPTLP